MINNTNIVCHESELNLKHTSKRKHWYKNNPEVISIVQHGVDRNLTNKEILEIITTHLGYPISDKTLQRIKKMLPKSNKLQLEIINKDMVSFILESINVLKFGEQIAVKIMEDSDAHPWIKLQALGMIIKYRREMAYFYDSSPVIASLADKLGGGNNVISEHKEISGKKQLSGSSSSS